MHCYAYILHWLFAYFLPLQPYEEQGGHESKKCWIYLVWIQ